MPTVAIFFGIVVQMYYRDHPPPHVHAYYQGFEALIAVETGETIAGALPAKAARIVADWVLARRVELLANWDRARRHEPLLQVPGADMS
ncbi:hypothetical protein STAQ_01860 [Allostella sp. ATCC 35155]|nr:hypothetical protein STAQ_01860 [Stella sp. ATCC 35155]